MFSNSTFQRLVEADNLTGEVVAVNSFIIEVKGLEGVRLGAQVLFEDGQHGLVREAYGDKVILFNVDSEKMVPGILAVVENDVLSVPVGKQLVGRVVTPMGVPVDGKGALRTSTTSGIFNPAPGIMARSMLNQQLATGVTAIDMFFPVVLGQRIAILGDSKSGKSTVLSQLSANQEGTKRIVVYVLIGKRKVDIERLLAGLKESGAMEHTIVVLADIFDSLTQSYLAPYAACAMAEHLWYSGEDVVIIYDDLSSHAEAYRQLSLLQEVDPGRDSYPGDMFYAHSSLLERAGKLLDGGKTLTALPVVLTPNDDITAYLSTSIMSITDGQIILDLSVFRRGIRPAVNAGLSVSRVGGQAQTVRQKRLSGSLFKMLARYKQAEEFSHFGSSLSKDARIDLTLGKQIYDVLQQPPEERHSLVIQQLMLETVILGGGEVEIDITGLKKSAKEVSSKVKEDKDFDNLEAELLKKHTTKVTEAPAVAAAENPASPAAPNAEKPADKDADKQKDGRKDAKGDKEKEQKESEEEGKEKEAEDKKDEATKDKDQDKDKVQEAKK
jgi:F-type H+-transporting ATPase subunit alpha